MTATGGGYPSSAQCRQRDPERARQAGQDLAKLMRDKLDVNIGSSSLRLFLSVYWDRVNTLAHIIHDNEDR